jgi:hypothetical protein
LIYKNYAHLAFPGTEDFQVTERMAIIGREEIFFPIMHLTHSSEKGGQVTGA